MVRCGAVQCGAMRGGTYKVNNNLALEDREEVLWFLVLNNAYLFIKINLFNSCSYLSLSIPSLYIHP